jgi:hypothetical protein
MDATLHLAEEWEKQPMLKRNIRVNISSLIQSYIIFNIEWYTNN